MLLSYIKFNIDRRPVFDVFWQRERLTFYNESKCILKAIEMHPSGRVVVFWISNERPSFHPYATEVVQILN